MLINKQKIPGNTGIHQLNNFVRWSIIMHHLLEIQYLDLVMALKLLNT
jgi:hypothetical protein